MTTIATELPDDWCHVHARRETATQEDWCVCVECGHVYRTEADLRSEHFVRKNELHDDTRDIEVCPFCNANWLFPPGSGSLI